MSTSSSSGDLVRLSKSRTTPQVIKVALIVVSPETYRHRDADEVKDDKVKTLGVSIVEEGQQSPVIVCVSDAAAGRFELLSGHRRFAAAQLHKLVDLNALVLERNADATDDDWKRDKYAASLTENLHREQISDKHKLLAIRKMIGLGFTKDRMLSLMGMKPTTFDRSFRVADRDWMFDAVSGGYYKLTNASQLLEACESIKDDAAKAAAYADLEAHIAAHRAECDHQTAERKEREKASGKAVSDEIEVEPISRSKLNAQVNALKEGKKLVSVKSEVSLVVYFDKKGVLNFPAKFDPSKATPQEIEAVLDGMHEVEDKLLDELHNAQVRTAKMSPDEKERMRRERAERLAAKKKAEAGREPVGPPAVEDDEPEDLEAVVAEALDNESDKG